MIRFSFMGVFRDPELDLPSSVDVIGAGKTPRDAFEDAISCASSLADAGQTWDSLQDERWAEKIEQEARPILESVADLRPLPDGWRWFIGFEL